MASILRVAAGRDGGVDGTESESLSWLSLGFGIYGDGSA